MTKGAETTEDTTTDPEVTASPSGKEETAQASGAATQVEKDERIPKARFQEVIAERNTVREKWEGAVSQLQDLQGKLSQQESLLNRIRSFAGDEKLSKHVFAIEKALRGEEIDDETAEELVEAAEGAKDGQEFKAVEKRLKELQSQSTEQIAEQRAEMLYTLVDNTMQSYIDALPEEYTDVDVENIQALWDRRVDWDAIDNNPNTMNRLLSASFQEVVDRYGAPRGAAKTASQETPTVTTPTPEPTAAEQLAKLLGNDKLGKFDDTSGKPLMTDDEFAKLAGQSLRISRLS
jgi:hypothetical protein